MNRTIEFKNFEQTNSHISADLHLDGEFLMRLQGNKQHLLGNSITDVKLYEYFREASLYYIYEGNICKDLLALKKLH